MERQNDQLFKLLIIGDSGVGKSSLLRRFTDNEFANNYICTIGVDFKVKTITVSNQRVKLQVWDTAGQERFRTITSTYYRGAHGVIIVYDVNDKATFDNVLRWVDEAVNYADNNIAMMLVGNKHESAETKEVQYDEGRKLANDKKCSFMETSAKDNINVDEMFHKLAEQVLQMQKDRKQAENQTLKLDVSSKRISTTNLNVVE